MSTPPPGPASFHVTGAHRPPKRRVADLPYRISRAATAHCRRFTCSTTEKTQCVGRTQLCPLPLGQEIGLPDHLPHRPLPQRVRVVAAEQHPVLADRLHQQPQRGRGRRPPSRRRSGRRRSSAGRRRRRGPGRPRRCQALSARPSQNGKLPPPWAKQIRSVSGTRSKTPPRISASTDRCVSAGIPVSQRAIQRSSRGPPGMSQGCTKTGAPDLRAVLQEGDDAGVVEVPVADVVADLHPGVARPPGSGRARRRRRPGPAAAPGRTASAGRRRRRSSPGSGR